MISTIAIVAIVLVLIAGAGILFMTRQGDVEKNNNVTTNEENDATNEPIEQPDQTSKEILSTNEYFRLLLPAGWSEDPTEYKGVAKDAAFRYKNDSGAAFAVVINIGPVGGIGDTGGTYEVINNKFKLQRNTEWCERGSDLCLNGDGQLKALFSSAEKVSGNNYLFDITHESQESQAALESIVDVIERIQVK